MSKVKVLLIDDDEDDYILTRDLFSSIDKSNERYELSWISDFDKGISAVLKRRFDIYLVDYRLGKLTGVDLLKEAILSGISEPIIIMTGKGDQEIDEQAMEIGAADYLVKDKVDADGLDRSLRYALKQSQALKALKESEKKFKVIFDKAKDPILVSDSTGKIHNINKSGLDFFGYHINDIPVINDRALFFTSDDRDNFIQEIEKKGAVTDFECQMVSSKGQVYFCSLSSFLQIDGENMLDIYHTIIHDLSYRKQQESNLLDERKFSISERIANGFAEEMRNPLSTINLVLNEIDNDEALSTMESLQVNLEVLRSNFEDINRLTKHFVDCTMLKPLVLNYVRINQLIEKALLAVEDLLLGQRIVLQKYILPNDIYLTVDEIQIHKCLVNVLSNAIEAMTVYPKILNISTINDSGHYSILIEDNSPGIPVSLQSSIFEPFFTTKPGADGLGLSETERILVAHNGSIEYKPQAHGSLFIIKLPIN